MSARGFACIGLDNPKSEVNVGSVLRAAGNYDAAMVAIGGVRPDLYMGRCSTDTMKAYRRIPVLRTSDLQSVIPYDTVPVAVDLLDDAIELPAYQHPERAFYIFGAEDATLGDRITGWCRDRVFVPTNRCMNLAACVNVVLYDRMAKARRAQRARDSAVTRTRRVLDALSASC